MDKLSQEDTQAIEVSFAAPVHISDKNYRRLMQVISDICDEYESAHPDRVMWVFGTGGKMLFNPYTLGDDEPMDFDMSVLSIECAERENYDYQASAPQ